MKQPVHGADDEVMHMPVVSICLVYPIWSSEIELGKVTDTEFSNDGGIS